MPGRRACLFTLNKTDITRACSPKMYKNQIEKWKISKYNKVSVTSPVYYQTQAESDDRTGSSAIYFASHTAIEHRVDLLATQFTVDQSQSVTLSAILSGKASLTSRSS